MLLAHIVPRDSAPDELPAGLAEFSPRHVGPVTAVRSLRTSLMALPRTDLRHPAVDAMRRQRLPENTPAKLTVPAALRRYEEPF